MKEKIKAEIDFLKQSNDKKFTLSLLFGIIILFVYCYFGSYTFFENTFTNVQNLQYWKIIYHNVMAFVLFFGVGTIYTKFIMKQKLTNFGLCFGDAKLSLKLCLIAIPIAFICGLSTVLDTNMVATYPLVNLSVYNEWYLILLYFVSYLLYYVGWEYLFRGILLSGSEGKCGVVGAILLTTLISALIHTSIAGFGKPMIETLSAIPAGVIFGYIAYKTKSIYPTIFIHFLVGFFTDICIFLIV